MLGRQNDRYRMTVASHSLRAFSPRHLDYSAELVFCVLQGPRSHTSNVPAKSGQSSQIWLTESDLPIARFSNGWLDPALANLLATKLS